jgi:hypothetical protein
MIQVDGQKNNVLIDGDLLNVSAELSLIIHDLAMIENVPADVLIGSFLIGLVDKYSGDTERYKRVIENVRAKVVDEIEHDMEISKDRELQRVQVADS